MTGSPETMVSNHLSDGNGLITRETSRKQLPYLTAREAGQLIASLISLPTRLWNVPCAGFLYTLNVGFLEPGEVHHTIDPARVPDANFSCSCTHIVERLRVGRLKPGLDLPQPEPRFLPGVSWECQQIVVG